MAPRRFRLTVVLCLVLVVLLPIPVARGATDPSPTTGWLTEIPQEIRSAVRTALWSESLTVTKPRNEEGKQFTWFYASEYLEVAGDRARTWVTIQRCLPDHMVTENWRYELEPRGREWRIVSREKVAEIADSFPRIVEDPAGARPVRPFRYERERFVLDFRGGSGVAVYRGDRVIGLLLAGEGHLSLTPPDDYALIFFRDRLHADEVDDDIESVAIFFHEADAPGWLVRVG